MKENLDRVAELERDLMDERRIRLALIQSSLRLNSTFNLPELLREIMLQAADLLGAEVASLLMYDEKKHEFTFETAVGETEKQVKILRLPADKGIAGWVLKNNKSAVVDDAYRHPLFYDAVDQSLGFKTRSMLAVPLTIRDCVIGVIEIINKKENSGFNDRDVEIATAFAAQAGVAINNANLYQKLADAVIESRMSYRL